MKVFVTGPTGFIGRHLVPALAGRGHDVVALMRSPGSASSIPWLQGVEARRFCLEEDPSGLDWRGAGALVHLAWPGLDDYRADIHLDCNLPASLALVESAISAGVGLVQVTGTCLEYGMVEGCLTEDMETRPTLPYAMAKDALRRLLFERVDAEAVTLQWIRLFYMYGEGQNPRSLLASLERSLEQGHASFAMSGGEQVRDYSPVEYVAKHMAALLECPGAGGIFNCGSGRGVTVRSLVERFLEQRGASIELNLGVYDYPDYEPMAFWGDNTRIENTLAAGGQAGAA